MPLNSPLRVLRTAIPYIRTYKGRTFVVKLSGRLCTPGRVLDHLVEQLALLYQLGIKLIIVHGGGDQANALSARLGVVPDIFAGRRITNDSALDIVKMAFAGTVNTDLVAAFRKVHVPAIGLTGVDANVITATRRPVQPMTDPATGETRKVDFGHVGDIEYICVDALERILADDRVPVVCSLAADSSGRILNVNADTMASGIAVEIRAAKYFLATDVDGVLRDADNPESLLTYLDVAELDDLIKTGAVHGGMLPKLAACTAALEGGVPRVHIVNGTLPDTLLAEVFTNEGCGTLLVQDRQGAKAGESQPVVP